MKLEEIKKPVLDIVSNKKYQWIATIGVLLVVLFLSVNIRISNWDLLTDSTTGEKIPLALDPFYFLRIAETLVKNDGVLPEFDEMRAPGFDKTWLAEIMPNAIVGLWKISGVFGEYTLREIDVISPVVFYAIALILFFILSYILTKSKLISILASSLLAFTPPFLYRTMAGFSDHEAIGILSFFAFLISFSLAFKYLDKEKINYKKVSFYALFVGLMTGLTIASWAGIAVFIFMIVPIAFFLFWIIKIKKDNSFSNFGILFYGLWILSSIIFSWVLGTTPSSVINKFLLGSSGIITPALFGLIIIDKLFISFGDKIKSKYYCHNKRIFYSLGILILIGIVGLPFIGKNFFSLIWEILNRLLNPIWGSGRLSLTVAENAQPFLTDWINTVGKPMFMLFVGGLVFIGINFAKNIKSFKNRILITLGFISMVFGILFSRISSTSLLSGNGIFSLGGLIYLGGIIFFGWAFFRAYFSNKIKINPLVIVLSSWMLVSIITGRSTTRMFFVIAPFMCFSAAYLVGCSIKKMKDKKSDEITRVFVVGLVVVGLVMSAIIINSSYNSVSTQAKYTGPSADGQWQNAMSWVRENTSEDAIFSHWWDYGYWVQTLGERATIADGGHAQGLYDGNHKIGRYILTTPKPETALSMFKTLGVDYLLIDQTDLGKYPAYSKIGGGDGENEFDRYSAIPIMIMDTKQTKEISNGTTIVFSGGSYIFEDIIYNDVFLPANKAVIIGIILNLNGNSMQQPEAVYAYNNIQTRIPIRYVYVNGEIVDFKNGLNATIDIIPAVGSGNINNMGAAIYLSQKVSQSLFAQLFLMDDPFNNYETLKLVHTEDNPIISDLKSQNVSIGDFIYYQGFRGPIKIWNTENILDEIKIVPEIKEPFNGTFGALDGMEFR